MEAKEALLSPRREWRVTAAMLPEHRQHLLDRIWEAPAKPTKAQYVPLDTKNTEVGWGIVHLYREGEEPETLGPYPSPEAAGGSGGTSASASASASASTNTSTGEDDGAILCIPAVPSYLSPSDFLGFIGEKWRGDVSHYRMVMTSRMNRYMVLMKFRDKWRAMDWRKEFDGKVFNSMVVRIRTQALDLPYRLLTQQVLTPRSPRFAMSPSSSRSRSRPRASREPRRQRSRAIPSPLRPPILPTPSSPSSTYAGSRGTSHVSGLP